jgi:aspartyl-tRNA(Asn)/glutamyl-tRNA(Gln) amidotransferase subunit C
MPVSVNDVRHVATLARLELSDEGAAAMTRDLNTILAHMEVLERVKTSGVTEASTHGAVGMRLHGDHGPSTPLAEPAESFAPEMRAGLLLVPRLATHEDAETP